MAELADALDLPRLPRRIECFDISNLHGTNPVASMVVFEQGRPAKKEYRRFGIKTVDGANDFAMMAEVIRRRFKRATDASPTLDASATPPTNGNDVVSPQAWIPESRAGGAENGEDEVVAVQPGDATPSPWAALPDLVIVDGGKGQLNAALAALAEVGMPDQPIVGLAKENEELFLPGQPVPVLLPRDSQALYLVQRVRDEAHRFAVTFHRQRRSKSTFHSKLDDVPGIGPKRKQALIRRFGSLKAVKDASELELATVDGITPALAAQIKATL
jgi:excinuclease ABC subunit C